VNIIIISIIIIITNLGYLSTEGSL